jgi:hypothetical protein
MFGKIPPADQTIKRIVSIKTMKIIYGMMAYPALDLRQSRKRARRTTVSGPLQAMVP